MHPTPPSSRALAVVVMTIVIIGSACSSSSQNKAPATFPQATLAPTSTVPGTGTTTPAPPGTGIIGTAQSVGCDTDLGTMETAVESFFALNGRYPANEAELVLGGILVQQSAFHDVGPNGAVVPAPGGGCVR